MSERTFIVFIDYSKAFDSVSHIQMFDILNDMGFPRHIVALMQALYEKQSAIVRWNGAHTKPFFIEKGVRQGCILSPLLFCAYTEQVRAKKATMELDTIWKDRGIRKELKMKLVKALIWPVITYGAEGWTLKKDDERRLEAAEMWCYRRMLQISWTEKRTNKSILNELQTRRELLAQIIKRKMAFFGHACRNNKSNLVKTCILGMMSGKRRRGRPRMQYIDNIKKWTRASLEENVRRTENRTA